MPKNEDNLPQNFNTPDKVLIELKKLTQNNRFLTLASGQETTSEEPIKLIADNIESLSKEMDKSLNNPPQSTEERKALATECKELYVFFKKLRKFKAELSLQINSQFERQSATIEEDERNNVAIKYGQGEKQKTKTNLTSYWHECFVCLQKPSTKDDLIKHTKAIGNHNDLIEYSKAVKDTMKTINIEPQHFLEIVNKVYRKDFDDSNEYIQTLREIVKTEEESKAKAAEEKATTEAEEKAKEKARAITIAKKTIETTATNTLESVFAQAIVNIQHEAEKARAAAEEEARAIAEAKEKAIAEAEEKARAEAKEKAIAEADKEAKKKAKEAAIFKLETETTAKNIVEKCTSKIKSIALMKKLDIKEKKSDAYFEIYSSFMNIIEDLNIDKRQYMQVIESQLQTLNKTLDTLTAQELLNQPVIFVKQQHNTRLNDALKTLDLSTKTTLNEMLKKAEEKNKALYEKKTREENAETDSEGSYLTDIESESSGISGISDDEEFLKSGKNKRNKNIDELWNDYQKASKEKATAIQNMKTQIRIFNENSKELKEPTKRIHIRPSGTLIDITLPESPTVADLEVSKNEIKKLRESLRSSIDRSLIFKVTTMADALEDFIKNQELSDKKENEAHDTAEQIALQMEQDIKQTLNVSTIKEKYKNLEFIKTIIEEASKIMNSNSKLSKKEIESEIKKAVDTKNKDLDTNYEKLYQNLIPRATQVAHRTNNEINNTFNTPRGVDEFGTIEETVDEIGTIEETTEIKLISFQRALLSEENLPSKFSVKSVKANSKIAEEFNVQYSNLYEYIHIIFQTKEKDTCSTTPCLFYLTSNGEIGNIISLKLVDTTLLKGLEQSEDNPNILNEAKNALKEKLDSCIQCGSSSSGSSSPTNLDTSQGSTTPIVRELDSYFQSAEERLDDSTGATRLSAAALPTKIVSPLGLRDMRLDLTPTNVGQTSVARESSVAALSTNIVSPPGLRDMRLDLTQLQPLQTLFAIGDETLPPTAASTFATRLSAAALQTKIVSPLRLGNICLFFHQPQRQLHGSGLGFVFRSMILGSAIATRITVGSNLTAGNTATAIVSPLALRNMSYDSTQQPRPPLLLTNGEERLNGSTGATSSSAAESTTLIAPAEASTNTTGSVAAALPPGVGSRLRQVAWWQNNQPPQPITSLPIGLGLFQPLLLTIGGGTLNTTTAYTNTTRSVAAALPPGVGSRLRQVAWLQNNPQQPIPSLPLGLGLSQPLLLTIGGGTLNPTAAYTDTTRSVAAALPPGVGSRLRQVAWLQNNPQQPIPSLPLGLGLSQPLLLTNGEKGLNGSTGATSSSAAESTTLIAPAEASTNTTGSVAQKSNFGFRLARGGMILGSVTAAVFILNRNCN